MDSSCNTNDNSMSADDAVSIAIEGLSLLGVSSNESISAPWNSDIQTVGYVRQPQFDENFNEVDRNNTSLSAKFETRSLPCEPSDIKERTFIIPKEFKDGNRGGLSSNRSNTVIPREMIMSVNESVRDEVKIDLVIRQNNFSNSQLNSTRILRPRQSDSRDCVITLYDSEDEESSDSDFTLDGSFGEHSEYQDWSTPTMTPTSEEAESSEKESLLSDGESTESSEEPCDSDENPSDSEEESATNNDDAKPESSEEPCDSDEESVASDDDDKPESSDEEIGDSDDEDTSSVVSSDHDEDESSDNEKSVDLGESSDSSSESSDGSE